MEASISSLTSSLSRTIRFPGRLMPSQWRRTRRSSNGPRSSAFRRSSVPISHSSRAPPMAARRALTPSTFGSSIGSIASLLLGEPSIPPNRTILNSLPESKSVSIGNGSSATSFVLHAKRWPIYSTDHLNSILIWTK